MSIKAQYNLYCDGCDAWEPHDTTAMAPSEIRNRAATLGWRRVGDRDYCPACWAKREKEGKER